MNGAGVIHDYELARIGATTESVARYIRDGQFGLWRETGELNDWIAEAARLDLGLGENVGRRIAGQRLSASRPERPRRGLPAGVPVTVHVGIGYDILHEHPNCDGAALGAASYRDFLIFAHVDGAPGRRRLAELRIGHHGARGLSQGAGHGAQRRRPGRPRRSAVSRTAVFDMVPIHGDFRRELPKTDPGYYFRPHKTMLVRTVADGGESYYFCGDHRATFPALRRRLLEQ